MLLQVIPYTTADFFLVNLSSNRTFHLQEKYINFQDFFRIIFLIRRSTPDFELFTLTEPITKFEVKKIGHGYLLTKKLHSYPLMKWIAVSTNGKCHRSNSSSSETKVNSGQCQGSSQLRSDSLTKESWFKYYNATGLTNGAVEGWKVKDFSRSPFSQITIDNESFTFHSFHLFPWPKWFVTTNL